MSNEGERAKGHEWIPRGSTGYGRCSCGYPDPKNTELFCLRERWEGRDHIASLEAQPEPTESYAQREADRTGKPYYVGPDNVAGGSHWIYPKAAHPSAGQSDASLEQEIASILYEEFHFLPEKSQHVMHALAIFIRARLAESRAAMREEAARVFDRMTILGDGPGDPYYEGYKAAMDAYKVLIENALPADSSALDARDARVKLEEFLLIKRERPIDPVYWDMHHKRELEERIAQRSAEKGREKQ